MVKSKQIVRLRGKKLKNGNISLFFDIYYKGKRSYEFPGLYLINDRKKDKETLLRAEHIRSKLQIEVVDGNYNIISEHKKHVNFLSYFKIIVNKKRKQLPVKVTMLNGTQQTIHSRIIII